MVCEQIELRGHLLDSLILSKVLDEIESLGGRFRLDHLEVGARRIDPSLARIEVLAPDEASLERILQVIRGQGAVAKGECDVPPLDVPAPVLRD